MAAIPEWVRGTNVLEAINAGTGAGLRLRGIQDEEEQQQQNNELRAKQIDAATALRQSTMSAMANYRNQQIQDAKQRIADQEAKQSAADVLRKSIGDSTRAFAKAVSDGTDPEKAYEDNPSADPKFVHPLLTESYKQKKDANKPAKTPHIDITSPDGKMRAIGLELDNPLLNQWGGTNASNLGTNRVNAAQALQRPAQPQSPLGIDTSNLPLVAPTPTGLPFSQPTTDLGGGAPTAQPDFVYIRDPKTGKMVLKPSDATPSAN